MKPAVRHCAIELLQPRLFRAAVGPQPRPASPAFAWAAIALQPPRQRSRIRMKALRAQTPDRERIENAARVSFPGNGEQRDRARVGTSGFPRLKDRAALL